MKEQCENCQHFWICTKSAITTKIRENLAKVEERSLLQGASGRIVFKCDYFWNKEMKE